MHYACILHRLFGSRKVTMKSQMNFTENPRKSDDVLHYIADLNLNSLSATHLLVIHCSLIRVENENVFFALAIFSIDSCTRMHGVVHTDRSRMGNGVMWRMTKVAQNSSWQSHTQPTARYSSLPHWISTESKFDFGKKTTTENRWDFKQRLPHVYCVCRTISSSHCRLTYRIACECVNMEYGNKNQNLYQRTNNIVVNL